MGKTGWEPGLPHLQMQTWKGQAGAGVRGKTSSQGLAVPRQWGSVLPLPLQGLTVPYSLQTAVEMEVPRQCVEGLALSKCQPSTDCSLPAPSLGEAAHQHQGHRLPTSQGSVCQVSSAHL